MSETTILPEPQDSPTPPPRGRRTAMVAGITAGTLAIVGAGAFAAFQFLDGGTAAESALPAESTLAVVSLDLDPSAKQKIEAIKTLQKFPLLKKELKLSSGDDLRKKFFDQAFAAGDCKTLSYEDDVKPWIGDNVAVAAASFEKGKVSPLVALAVTDEDKAARGLDALIDCADAGDEVGYAFHDGFVLVSDSKAHATEAVDQATSRPLSDDATYTSWTDKVGDRGILSFYVAKEAADAMADGVSLFGLFGGNLAEATITSEPELAEPAAYTPSSRSDDPQDQVRKALKDFRGAAGTLRFADGGAELHVVGGLGGKSDAPAHPVSEVIGSLPADTTAVVGFSPPPKWADELDSQLDGYGMFLGAEGGLRELLEDELGLTVPDDLRTLLGEGLAFSVRGTPPPDFSEMNGPEEMPVGLTLKGDPDAIEAVIAKIEAKQGTTLADEGVTVATGSDRVTLSFDEGYGKDLLADGGLADDETFQKLVPEADKASMVVYVDLNSAWRQAIADTLTDSSEELVTKKEFLDNTEALEGLGLSSWVDGGDPHLLVKLTTD